MSVVLVVALLIAAISTGVLILGVCMVANEIYDRTDESEHQ